MNQLGKNIKRFRLEKGLSQEALASAIGVKKSAISKYELGHRQPSLETIHSIASILSVPFYDLLNCEEEVQQGLSNGLVTPDDIAKELNIPCEIVWFVLQNMNNWDSLPKSQQEKFDSIHKKIIDVGGMLSVEMKSDIYASVKHYQQEITYALYKLNEVGREKALERILELTEIPRFQIQRTIEEDEADGTKE